MKSVLTSIALLAATFSLSAQQPAEQIPAKALMVLQINPGPVAAAPELQRDLQNQLYGNNKPFESLSRYTNTHWWVEGAQRDSLDAFIKQISINGAPAGIQSASPMFVYSDTRDTVSVLAYVFTLDNPEFFLKWSQNHLFTGDVPPTVQQRNGYSFLQQGHITVTAKNKTGWVLIADYNYHYTEPVYYDYNEAVAVEAYDETSLKLRMLADSIKTADSILQVEEYKAQKEYERRDSLEEAAYNEFETLLNDDNYKTYDSIVNVVMKDREKRRKKREMLGKTVDEEVAEIINKMREEYRQKKIPLPVFDEPTIGNVEEPMPGIDEPQIQEIEPPQVTQSYDYSDDYGNYSWRNENKKRDSLVNRNILLYLDEVMTLRPEQSIARETHFAAIDKTKNDAVYYFSYSRLIEVEWMQEYNRYRRYISYDERSRDVRIAKADSLFRNSIWYGAGLTGAAQLTGNHLEVTQQFFFNPEVTKLTKGLFRGKIDKGLLSYVKTNPYSVLSISADPEKIIRLGGRGYREYINLMYSAMIPRYGDVYANLFSVYRVFLDDDIIYNLFSGDAVFAVTDFVPKVRKYRGYDYDDNFNPIEKEMQDVRIVPEFVFAASIGKKKEMKELLNIAVRSRVLIPVNDYYVLRDSPRELAMIYVALHKGKLIITNDSILITENLKHGYAKGKKLSSSERRELRSSPVSGWWDAERTRLTLQQRGEQNESSYSRRNRYSKITNRMKFRGKRGPGGSNQIEFSADFTDDGLPEYGYIRMLRILRLMYHLDRSF